MLNDIALLRLTTPAELNQFVQIACLPNPRYNRTFPQDNVISWGVGWGVSNTSTDESPDNLYDVKLTIYNSSMCGRIESENVMNWNSQICAGIVLTIEILI